MILFFYLIGMNVLMIKDDPKIEKPKPKSAQVCTLVFDANVPVMYVPKYISG